MKLLPTTPLNLAIKKMAEGDAGTASVIALLNRVSPEHTLGYLRALDRREIYGGHIASLFWNKCRGDVYEFISEILKNGEA
jgi:hypothetical protein